VTAVALAIASAAKDAAVPAGTAAFGEIGLTGRLRPATQAERRLEECEKLGLTDVIVPAATKAKRQAKARQVETLREAIGAALASKAAAGEPRR
jgi:DNA repair protein RadA/Sms